MTRLAARGKAIGSELYADSRLAVDDNHVPVVVGIDVTAKYAGPEGALGLQVSRIEGHDLVLELHHDTLSQVAALSSEADQQVDGDVDPTRPSRR